MSTPVNFWPIAWPEYVLILAEPKGGMSGASERGPGICLADRACSIVGSQSVEAKLFLPVTLMLSSCGEMEGGIGSVEEVGEIRFWFVIGRGSVLMYLVERVG